MPQFRICGSVFVDCRHTDRLLQTARLWEPSSCMYRRVVMLMGVLVVSKHVLCNRTVCQWKKPNSITLAGSKLVRSWSSTSFEAVCDQLRTSLEPASVMEFGLNRRRCVIYTASQKVPTFKLSATLSNLNRFSKFLHYWKAYKFATKSIRNYPPHVRHWHVATLPWEIKNSAAKKFENWLRFDKLQTV